MTVPSVKRYRKIAAITVGAVVFLILVGGIVRMTGAGMGCPDWPKCFGQWIPPTDISELPPDYKTRFQVVGKEIADFDAFKTWVEYVNRLIGVLIGFFAILTVVVAIPLRKEQKSVFRLSLAGLLLTIIQGGIGAYVVRTNLQTGTITIHMVMALVILAVFIFALLQSYKPNFTSFRFKSKLDSSLLLKIGIGVLIISFAQIILGTQIRESIDLIAKQLGEEQRGNWIGKLGNGYTIHKFFYYVVVGVILFWSYKLKPYFNNQNSLKYLTLLMIGTVGIEILLGLGMHHLGIPPLFQPLHLLFATILFGAELSLLGIIYLTRNQIEDGF